MNNWKFNNDPHTHLPSAPTVGNNYTLCGLALDDNCGDGGNIKDRMAQPTNDKADCTRCITILRWCIEELELQHKTKP